MSAPTKSYLYSFIRADHETVTIMMNLRPDGEPREHTINHKQFVEIVQRGYVEPQSFLCSHAVIMAELASCKTNAVKTVQQLGTDKANLAAEVKGLRQALEAAEKSLVDCITFLGLAAKHCPEEPGVIRDGNELIAEWRGLRSTMLANAEAARKCLNESVRAALSGGAS